MGRESKDRFDASAKGIVQEESLYYCSFSGIETRFAKRASVRHANAYIFYQSCWKRPQRVTASGAGTGEIVTKQANSSGWI
jgi:hypothetical protein